MEKFAILFDGGFVTKRLSAINKAFPSSKDIGLLADKISKHPHLNQQKRFRIYFYDAEPYSKTEQRPITGLKVEYSKTEHFKRYHRLLDEVRLLDDFALRLGETLFNGWKLGDKATKSMLTKPRVPEEHDFVPDISQKGVDLRIGLDIARLSLRKFVDTIVLVTNDSDMIPALKFARREGTYVYLCELGHGARPELKHHTDRVLSLEF